MDSQAQLQRTHAQHQAEKPIKIHHPEEEEHTEKGPSKVLKKVKEKAKKIKKAITKHGHGHEEHIPDDHDLDEEDDEDDHENLQVLGGVPAREKAHNPVTEDIVPPGTNVFPVVSSSHTKSSEPIRGVEPILGSNASHGYEALSRPVRPSGMSEKEERRGSATMTPHNTPVSLLSATEDVTRTFVPGEHQSRDQRKVNMERHRGFEEDSSAPGGKSEFLGGMSNYQSKVDPSRKGRRKGAGEDDQSGLGRDLTGDEMQQPNQSSYTDKIASVTSVVADKAMAAKNVVASKLGYSEEGGHESRVEGAETQGSTGYGTKVSGMITPVYEKVKETGASVMTKLTPSTETQTGQDKGVSAKEYLTEKLSPGEEDGALSEVVAENLHLGGGDGENANAPVKKGIVTQSEEVEKRLGKFTDETSGEAMKHGEAFAEEGEGGMVDKLRGAVTSWISGTTEEVVQKSTESVQDSSQSVGATVGNMGFSGSGADGAGQRSGEKSGSVPVQKGFQESRN